MHQYTWAEGRMLRQTPSLRSGCQPTVAVQPRTFSARRCRRAARRPGAAPASAAVQRRDPGAEIGVGQLLQPGRVELVDVDQRGEAVLAFVPDMPDKGAVVKGGRAGRAAVRGPAVRPPRARDRRCRCRCRRRRCPGRRRRWRASSSRAAAPPLPAADRADQRGCSDSPYVDC